MAIGTYAELQTAVSNWLDKDNLTSRIPEFISLAENKLNRKLRLREQNQISTATYPSGSRFVELPDGFIELLNLLIKPATAADTSYTSPIYVAAEMLPQYYGLSGTPKYYTLRDQIEFNCEVSANHTLRMYYLKKWDIATDDTNWLLTNYEDAYVYGALVEAEFYLKNDERIPRWEAVFKEVMTELNELDERSQDDSILEAEACLLDSNNSGYNILNQ